MRESKVVYENGRGFLLVDGKAVAPVAYITYFDELNDYKAFADAGYRLFSVPVALAGQAINPLSDFRPHAGGVFDVKGEENFTFADQAVKRILDACPDALIFPRFYVAMPDWWIRENPTETVPVKHGLVREALYSHRFRENAAYMIRRLIEHYKKSPFADSIIGYQISGGKTEEWFHLDISGSYCENALPYLSSFLGREVKSLPSLAPLEEEGPIVDPDLLDYIRFANESVAETVAQLCRAAKEAVDGKQIIGAFYGYTMEVNRPLYGTHALKKLLDCPYIDFFSSPLSYTKGRALGIDWPDMQPMASLRLHEKLCFSECDIRTHLSVYPNKVRPGCDPYNVYEIPLWLGPDTEEGSVSAMRKSWTRQIAFGGALWWLDLFGKWYDSPRLMEEAARARAFGDPKRQIGFDAPCQIALFTDEDFIPAWAQSIPPSP